jgi:hypothetical protein
MPNKERKLMKYIIAACVPLLLVGCSGDYQYYRYPCQDPANWETAECKKPLCEVSRTCPEHIFDNEKEVMKLLTPVSPVTKIAPKGECQ